MLALLATAPAFAQEAAPAAPAEVSEEDVVVLSPFVVDAEKDHGYYAENTLAGSRLNTKISDLAPSISVITKQLMEDTASTDINDIFRYEINTEGSLTYTPAQGSLRSDGVVDVNAGAFIGSGSLYTNATANRVRGLGSPTTAINYYPSISQIPADSYNLQTVEINRGPNSMLFGMGSPAGIVNLSTQSALLTQDFNKLGFRFDSEGSMRGSFSFNRALIKDKLAIYGAYLADERRFERRPSYDNTKRMYGAITVKPFAGTTIRANVEWYKNNNRRPNTLTPRDFITEWKDAGSPTYNALTGQISANGAVKAVFVAEAGNPEAQKVRDFVFALPNFDASKWDAANNTYNGVTIFGETAISNANSIMYVPGFSTGSQFRNRTVQQISGGELLSWFQPTYLYQYRDTWGTATNPAANAPLYAPKADIFASSLGSQTWNRYFWEAGNFANAIPSTLASYKFPGVTDKSIYDWEKVNINQMNFGDAKNMTYNVDLEQKILDNLYFTAGWFRQDYVSTTNYTVAQLNVATLFVDPNLYLPDGSVNTMYGKPYLLDQDADQWNTEIDANSYRAMLAYTPDFTKNKNWTKWFGRHQILGLWSRDETVSTNFRKRLEYLGSSTPEGMYRYGANQNANSDGSATGWNYQTTAFRRMFYLAGEDDPIGTVTRSSGEWNYLNYTGDISVMDYATDSFKTLNMTTAFNVFDGGTGRSQRILDSKSAGITSYLWNNRLVTTFGVRRDENRARLTNNGVLTFDDGTTVPAMTNPEKWVDGVYQYDTVFKRWNEWSRINGTTKTMGGVFKPFLGWSGIERRANSGNPFWQFVRDFGVSYNKSDNFNAPAGSYVDAFGVTLPKPVGNGEDYGFQFSLFDNKFFARVTWFKGTNENELTNPGTSISRLNSNVDTTLFQNWARTIAMINMGMDPTAEGFGTNLEPAVEQQVKDAAAAIWGMPYTYYGDLKGNIYATRSAEAKGVELQLNYNPTPGWTMRLTAGKQDTKYSDVLKEFDAWYAYRADTWDNAKASDYLLPQYQQYASPYLSFSGREVNLSTFWSSYGYNTNIALDQVDGYYNAQLYYNGVVLPQYQYYRDLDGQSAPGQRKYRWSYMTNYVISTGKLAGFGFGGSQRWEDKAVIGYFGKASGANGTKLDVSDITKPIYDDANWYTDLWVSYSTKILKDKVNMKIQLNVDNVFENGGLRVTAVNYDGSPYAYRIIDSRLFKLTTTFDF